MKTVNLVIDINLKGVIMTTQAATQVLLELNSGQDIINSSVIGRQGTRPFQV